MPKKPFKSTIEKLCLFLSAALLSQALIAQDVHFSQYNEAPLILNPGLTGLFTGDHRISTSYRSQWASMDVPFITYAFAVDTRFFTESASSLGVGIMAYRDMAGNNNFSTTDITLNLSGVISVNKHQSVSIGLSGGMLQKGLDPNELQWESQYVNGAFDPSTSSGEAIDLEPALMGNFSMGMAWWYFSKESHMMGNDQVKATAGFAYHHVNKPRIKFYTSEQDRLQSKLVAHGTAQIGIKGTHLAVVPGGFFAMQGASTELLAGAMLRVMLQEESNYMGLLQGMALSMGCHYRLGDAVIPSILFEFTKFRLGFSYDITTSELGEVNIGQGGPEFTISFISPNPFTYKKNGPIRPYL